jgi:hypothetical protein
MEDFLVVILFIAVVYLLYKQSTQADSLPRLLELSEVIRQLERRLSVLERTPRAPVPIPVPSTVQEPPPTSLQPLSPQPQPPSAASAPIRTPTFAYQSLPSAQPPLAKMAREPRIADFLQPSAVASASAPSTPAPSAPAPPLPRVSLEERLGRNWLNKLGIVTLVIGLALFLGYQLRTLGPLGKSLLGLALSALLLGGGIVLERRERYRIFARAAIGGGWALTFFVTFALYHVDAMQILHSQAVDLVLMFLVAGAMVGHSLLYKSQVVTTLAFALALVTVGISHVTLFSLVAGALLASGLVLVAARERWFELGLAGVIALYFNHFLWLTRVLPDGGHPGVMFPEFLPSAGLLLFYWLLFRLFFVLRVPLDRRQQLFSSLTAIANSAGMLFLLKYQSAHPEWAFYSLLALGFSELLLAFLGRQRWRGAFIVLSSIASVLLLAAIPFRFTGAPWSILWLLEAEIFFLAGVRMPESVFRRLGILANFGAVIQILIIEALPSLDKGFVLTLGHGDRTPDLHAAIALLCGTVVLWFNSEFATRRWPSLFLEPIDQAALGVSSYLAALTLALALWVAVPMPWTVVAWGFATVAIALAADRLESTTLATQSDCIALLVILRSFFWNLGDPASHNRNLIQALTISFAAALLYLGTLRKTRSFFLPTEAIPAAWSWPATALLATLAWYQLEPRAVIIAWGILALSLFEAGILFNRPYLRLQAYTLFAASFLRLSVNLQIDAGISPSIHRASTVLPLIAAYIWVYERTRRALASSPFDLYAGVAASWSGTLAALALLAFMLHVEHIVIGWALLAAILLYVAWLLKRPIFTAQALAVLIATAGNAFIFPLAGSPNLSADFWHSRIFFVGSACLLMLLALPAAFAIRRDRQALGPSTTQLDLVLTHPEQPFFFVPLTLTAALLAVELRTGSITIGWIVLGLAAFLFALPLGERSYRLGGLILLLVGLAKILFIDIWSATPTDRYLTLIVTGAALLLVSFLYSRYRETILRFL